MRRLFLTLGALAALALMAVGAGMLAGAIEDFGATRIGETRTAIPGERTARLEPGKHVVYYEVDEGSVPGSDSGGDGEIAVPAGLPVSIRRDGDGRPLDLDDYGSDFNVSSGGRFAQAAATVEVPEEGSYSIEAGRVDASPASEPAVVLGRPITGRVLRLVVGIAGIVAGLGLAVLVAVVAVALAARRRRGPVPRE